MAPLVVNLPATPAVGPFVVERPLLWFVLLCLAASGCVLGVLAARRRHGVGILWLWVGATTMLMWMGSGRPWPFVGPTGQRLGVGSGVIVPSFLLLLLLVYLEHGARDARRVLAGIIGTGVFFQLFNMLAAVGGGALAPSIGWRHIGGNAVSEAIALGTMSVVYQTGVSRRWRVPVLLLFCLALGAGTAVDAVVFPLFAAPDFGVLERLGDPAFVLSKLLSTALVSLPAVLYLRHQLRRGRTLAVQEMSPLAIAGLGDEGPLPDVAMWRSMAERLGDGLTVVAAGRVVYANAAMARIAGHPGATDLRDVPLDRYVAPEDLERVRREQYERQMGTRGTEHLEWTLVRVDGTRRQIASTSTPGLLGGARVTIALHRDVTEDRAARAALQATTAALHTLVASASSLVASLDPAVIVPAITERAQRLVAARGVYFYERTAEGDRLVRRHALGRGAPGRPSAPPEEEPEAEVRARAEAEGARLVSLVADARDYGLLVVMPPEGHPGFSRDEVALLEALGAIGAAALRTAALLRDLGRAEARYETLFEHVPAPVWLYDPETLRVLAVNEAAVRRYGWPREALGRMTLGELAPPAAREAFVAGVLPPPGPAGTSPPLLARHRDRRGEEFDVLVSGAAVELEGRRLALATCVDLTLERRNQERIQTSQRLESLGRLAGGIAHDFNNILTALQVDLAVLAEERRDDAALLDELAQLRASTERAADLTRQVLLFSRGEEAKRRPVALDDVVRDVERLLARALGGTVVLEVRLGAGATQVSADPSQLQSVLLNLCLNARDAMPRGGALTIRTALTVIDRESAERLGMHPGASVTLEVEDAGTGMAPEVLSRAMEPFFTTKPLGQGTGLGLSIVHGIARAHEGAVEIASAPGQGTRVALHLPRLAHEAATPSAALLEGLHGGEMVLLVDDEAAVRRAGSRMLRRFGYRVILAEDGADALEQLEAAREPVDLVVTDMVMPRMDARDLLGVLRERRPALPILLSTGYDAGRLTPGDLQRFDGFVPKPYTPEELLSAVRRILDRRG